MSGLTELGLVCPCVLNVHIARLMLLLQELEACQLPHERVDVAEDAESVYISNFLYKCIFIHIEL